VSAEVASARASGPAPGPGARIAVALDVPTLGEAEALARVLAGRVGWFKVGLELFVAHGPAAVAAIAAHGPVFLDLKLHDIPTTVARAVRSAAGVGAGLLTVHAAGGPTMLRAAREAAGDDVRLVAVTVLTSLGPEDLAALRLPPADERVPHLASLAVDAGLDALVCAPADLGAVRAAVGAAPLLITPGIRAAADAADDHARARGPVEAVAAGADLLVVGRPITRADDPAAAATAIADLLAAEGDAGP
jgi:orotidine-5'-phosphate decarboxylase